MFKRRRDGSEGEAPAAPAAPLFPPQADRVSGATGAADTGLGVPPFRPATPPRTAENTPAAVNPGAAANKEMPTMARTPFNAPPPPNQPPATPPGIPPRPNMAPGQPGQPGGPGAQPAAAPAPRPQERRTLVVGRGISLQGLIQDAERLVVEGTVEAQLIHAAELAVAPGGIFKGEVEVEDAEIAGTIDGTVTARGSLVIRGTGRVIGTARCRRLQVEDGGQITGRMEMITEPAGHQAPAAPPAPPQPAAPPPPAPPRAG